MPLPCEDALPTHALLPSSPSPSSPVPTNTTTGTTPPTPPTPVTAASTSTSPNPPLSPSSPFHPSTRLLSPFHSPHERTTLMRDLKSAETTHMRRRLAQLPAPDATLLSADPLVCEELWRMRRDGEAEAFEGGFSDEDERRAWGGVYGGLAVWGRVEDVGMGVREGRERKESWERQEDALVGVGGWSDWAGYEAGKAWSEDGDSLLWDAEAKDEMEQKHPWVKEVLQWGEEDLASRIRSHLDALSK